MLRVILIALLATFILSDTASAQRRGRFFQRVKQDIFGVKPAAPTPSKTAGAKTPTPSQNKSVATRPSPSRSQQQLPSRGYSQSLSQGYSQTHAPKPKYTGSPRKGFGFQVVENDSDQLIVGQLNPRGNGAEAGLRRGDHVVEIGGIEATSIKEYEEIAKIMQDGDQMEFKIKRSGIEKPMLITFGNAPQMDDEETPVSETGNSIATGSNNNSRRYDFAPPQNSSASRNGTSILDNPAPGPRSNTQQVNSQRNVNQNRFINQTNNNNVVVQQMRDLIQRQNQQIRNLQSELARMKRFGR